MKHLLFQAPDGESSDHQHYSLAKLFFRSTFKRITSFIERNIFPCLFLLLTAVIVLVWTPFQYINQYYNDLISLKISVCIANLIPKETRYFWISNSLLTLFFFPLGLKIKYLGLTSSAAKKSIMPAVHSKSLLLVNIQK